MAEVNYKVDKINLVTKGEVGSWDDMAQELSPSWLTWSKSVDPRNEFHEKFEDILNQWLIGHLPLMCERILSFQQLVHGKPPYDKYHELDLVVGERGLPQYVIEVKTSINLSKPIMNARKQLNITLPIIRERWPEVNGCILAIDISALTNMRVPKIQINTKKFKYFDLRNKTPEALPNLLIEIFTYHSADMPTIVLSGEDVWTIGIDQGLANESLLEKVSAIYRGKSNWA